MKFLCDRCKTRYSIGDDRVRGKILKIRCKNCANVITVREGMTDADAAAAEAPRRTKAATAGGEPTTIGPPAGLGNGAGQGALGAAFASALTTTPPSALEEEWYVSIDGDQSGPFSLVDAQRWVASKPFDADLHCWSEGFDDWLPVDKVSHFRGLRKRPIAPPLPVAPPPMPRAPGMGGSPAHRLAAQSPQTQKIDESEPKPLFAATMASLERSVPSASNPGMVLPSLNGNGAARATPPGGHGAIASMMKPANGAGAVKVPTAIPSMPLSPVAPAISAKGTQSEPVRGPAPRNAFDVGDQATQIEAPPFDDEAHTAAEPAARKKREDVIAASAASAFREAPKLADKAANAPMSNQQLDDDDDDLQIGEVSRVVNLADLLGTKPKPKRAETVPNPRASGPIPLANRTGAVPRIGNTAAVPRIDDPSLAAGLGADPMVGDAPNDLAMAPAVQATHRRGLIILIAVATLLLAGVIIAVVTLVGDDSDITMLGRGDTIDTTRPDDPLRPRTGDNNPPTGSAANPFFPQAPKNTYRPPKNPIITPQTPIDDPPGGQRIGGDDVEAMARSQSSTTQRCYMRAQRGVDAILIGDVKKINVTLEISPDGSVRTVSLSSNSDNTLGKCLISAIRGWKFRTSPGGTYKFALVFSAG